MAGTSLEPAAGAAATVAEPPVNQCRGVAGRPCKRKATPPKLRCTRCRRKHRKLKKQQYNNTFHQRHGAKWNAERRQRRHRRRIKDRGPVIHKAWELRSRPHPILPSPAALKLPPFWDAYKAAKAKPRRGRPPLSDEEKLLRKQRLAVALLIRIERDKEPPHAAWYSLHPTSKASRESATREALRLVRWCKTHFLSEADWLYLAGFDLDVYCQHLKELLNANLYRKGQETEHPNWAIRRRALCHLMIGLGLATVGLRSGPRAVGGALANVPIEMNGAGELDMDPETDLLRKLKAETIIFRHRLERKPLADCWYEAHPDSQETETRESAARHASQDIAWYLKRYSQSLAQRLIANGLDNHTVLEGIAAMLNATRERSTCPDWSTRIKGFDLLMILHGRHHHHPSRKPPPNPATITLLDALV